MIFKIQIFTSELHPKNEKWKWLNTANVFCAIERLIWEWTSIQLKYVQEKKERKKMAMQWLFPILSMVLHYYLSGSRLAKRKELVSQGTYQQIIRKVSANVLEMPCISLCIYLSSKLSIIFLLPSKQPTNLEEENLQCGAF